VSQLATTRVFYAALFMLGGACSPAQVWPPSPATLQPGEESCAGCRMFVSDPRFAAQRHARDGSLEWFDDLGCLAEKYGPDDSDPEGVFVRAFTDADWLRGDRGYVLHAADIGSPMGYGWRAYATQQQAQGAAIGHADTQLLPIIDFLRGGAAGSPPRPPDQNPKAPQRN
jgi:hypothetical protein